MDKLKAIGAFLKRNKRWVAMLVIAILGLLGFSQPEEAAQIIDLIFSFLP